MHIRSSHRKGCLNLLHTTASKPLASETASATVLNPSSKKKEKQGKPKPAKPMMALLTRSQDFLLSNFLKSFENRLKKENKEGRYYRTAMPPTKLC